VGGLLTPCALAVTSATPVGPGVHTCGLLREFQLPAHANPLVATVSTAGLLDWKDMGWVAAAFAAVNAAAVKAWFVPISMEKFGPGERVTLAGTAKLVVWTAPLLPHPPRPATSNRTVTTTAKPVRPDLPMHPPRPGSPTGEQYLLM